MQWAISSNNAKTIGTIDIKGFIALPVLHCESYDMDELLKLSATQAVDLISRREITPLELVEASAARIEQVEPAINAMPTRCIERAVERARMLTDQSPSEMASMRGWLGGLPVSVKDLVEVKGVRTTFGSPVYAKHVPSQSDILVQRIESRGAIVMGKSNTPEFGAGASTFNEVFGTTCNPWDTSKSVAGSSGGACASVAAGEVWLATGSDLGGSLRTPASFNSVVGLRPSPGRVPHSSQTPFDTLHVYGPIARNVEDAALFLDSMAGFHASDPLSYPESSVPYVEAVSKSKPPLRIAYSPDLGITPIDSEVESICRRAVENFANMGSAVIEDCPNLKSAIDCFNVLRAASFATTLAPELRRNARLLKPEVVWNIEQGLKLTAGDIAKAERQRRRIFRSTVRFFDNYDLLVCPCAIVPPFDAQLRHVESLDGEFFDSYYEWIAITFAITLTSCPALALPAGFTGEGLPVGLQLIAPPRDESGLLSAGYLFEQQSGIFSHLPIDPVVV